MAKNRGAAASRPTRARLLLPSKFSTQTASTWFPTAPMLQASRNSERLELSSWASQEAARFREYMPGKSAYDIQEFCFDYVRNEFKPDAEQQAAIKECALENGIDTQSVLDVLAVELRDALLGDRAPPE